MTKVLTVPYEASLPSFGSPAARKNVRPRDFVLQGNNGGWVTIPSAEYELDKKNGIVRQRSEDSAGNDVDWEAYVSYRWSGVIVTSGSRATITNEALTFADADYADIEAGPDEQIQESLASDSVEQDDNSSDESQSDNYVAGVSGYFIDRVTGNAEFNNITARGTIVATAGSIGGWTITATALYKDTGVDATSAGMSPSDYPFYAGATYANRANAPYRVLPDGSVFATQYFKIGSNDLVFDNATDQLVWLKGLSFDRLDVATTGTFNLDTQGRSWIRLTGTATAKTINYIKKPSNIAGQILIIKNDANPVTVTKTSQLTLKNNQGSPPAGYAAMSLYGKNVVLKSFGTVTLIYDSANARWTLAAVVKATKTKNNSELSEEGYDEDVSVTSALPTSTSARAGTDVLTLSAGTLAVDMDIPASSTWTMELVTPADGTTWLFANGDTAYMRSGANEIYFTVARDVNDGVTQTYTCTFANGTRPLSFAAGSGVLNYGASGQGFLYETVVSGLPYMSVRTHSGSPWSPTERVRLGSLTGITDPTFGALSGYGLWTDNVYLTGAIKSTSGQIGGWNIGASSLTGGSATLHSSGYLLLGTSNDIVRLDAADATYRLWIGNATAASAPFRVTKAGAVTASNIDLAGGSVSGTFTVSGTLRSAASPNARYELTGAGFKSYDSGNVQRTQILNDGSGWLGSSSVFSWTAAGVVSLNGSAVVGNSLSADKVSFTAPTISGLTLTNNSPSAGYVAWSSFTLTYQGVSYTVASGNSNSKYIYWKKSVSTTVLQASATIPANAPDMFIVCVNFSGTAYQSNFAPFVYADYISVGNLAAISAAMGTLTSGTIVGSRIATSDTGARTELHYNNLFGLGFGGIGGTDGTTTQWYAKASDGKIYAGGGNLTIDANGLRFVQGSSGTNSVEWYSGANVVGRAYAVDDGSLFNTLYLSGRGVTGTRNGRIYCTVTDSAGATTGLFVVSDNSVQLSNANLVWNTDNAYDLGYYGSTAYRPRNVYVAEKIFLNETANANAATASITIHQGGNNNEAFAIKRTSVAHGMTSLTETDTYGTIKPFQTTNGALGISGYSASTIGINLGGYYTTGNTSRSTSAVGGVVVDAYKKSGGGKTTPAANENLFVVRSNTAAKFLVDAEGDIHMDATSNINAWDDHDDVALLEAYRVKTAQPPNYRREFAHDVEKYAQILHDTGVLTLNPDGHHFVSMKGLFGLTIDALRQLALRVDRYERALVALGVDARSLDA